MMYQWSKNHGETRRSQQDLFQTSYPTEIHADPGLFGHLLNMKLKNE